MCGLAMQEGGATAGADAPGRSTLFDPLELYASGIDSSDYVARVAPLVRDLVPIRGDLLDVGAGGGQLGVSLREAGRRWTAVEPSSTMARRLRRLPDPPTLLPSAWDDAGLGDAGHDTVLAANMPAPLGDAPAFLARCRDWSRARVVWVVPAQNGPRGLCLAGCLPREWHGEDETPGIDIVLGQLAPSDRPGHVLTTDWSFRLTIPNLPDLAGYLADRLSWPADDGRRPALLRHLAGQAEPVGSGFRLTVPRASAVLVWGQTS